jgi:hypothetical protein
MPDIELKRGSKQVLVIETIYMARIQSRLTLSFTTAGHTKIQL